MNRISPWQFSRPRNRTETIELPELDPEEEREKPDYKPTCLVLREAADNLRQGQIWDLVERYCYQHVAPPGKKPRQALAGPDREVVETSRDLFYNVAAVELMQVPQEGQEPFQMLEIIGIAKCLEHRWKEILEAVQRLSQPAPKAPAAEGALGNSAAGGTTESSAPA